MIPPKGFKPVPLYSIEHNYTHRKEAKKGWFYWSPSDPNKTSGFFIPLRQINNFSKGARMTEKVKT